jgi:hypothetical protein
MKSSHFVTPAKFNVGDRVVLARGNTSDQTEVGQAGTVIELSCAPWVRFDKLTGHPYGNVFNLTGWKNLYMDCLAEEQLEREA